MRITGRAANRHDGRSQRGPVSIRVAWVVAAMCLCALVLALPQPREALARGFSFITHPSLMVGAIRRRAAYPEVRIDVDLVGFQQLTSAADASTVPEPVCVSAMVSSDLPPAAALVCRTRSSAGSTRGATPTLRITMEGDGALLGMRQAVASPAGTDTALAISYADALRSASLPVPALEIARMSVNGSRWGLYVVEELLSAEPQSEAGLPFGAVIVSFETPVSREAVAGAPGSDFARARAMPARVAGGTEADWAAAVASDPQWAVTGADALRRLQGVLVGDLRPSQILDAESFGQFMALTALWRGVRVPDWRTLQLVYDPAAAKFTPLGTARPQSGATPLPPQFYRDPELQFAYARALDAYSDPGLVDELLASSRLPELYAALGGYVWGMGGLRDTLVTNQAAMQALIAPPETLKTWLGDEDGYLALALEATEPFPVEILGLDLGEQSMITLEKAWVVEPSPGSALVDTPGIVLRARTTDVPVVASIRIPLDVLPSAVSSTGLDLWTITRVWGLSEEVRVHVIVSPIGGGYGEF